MTNPEVRIVTLNRFVEQILLEELCSCLFEPVASVQQFAIVPDILAEEAVPWDTPGSRSDSSWRLAGFKSFWKSKGSKMLRKSQSFVIFCFTYLN